MLVQALSVLRYIDPDRLTLGNASLPDEGNRAPPLS
jgi:hypothetical protein